ncbi:hypothetical protein [uncultured Kingella sp.]|nr:hypothetical protein [uncultured Kingella sp.]
MGWRGKGRQPENGVGLRAISGCLLYGAIISLGSLKSKMERRRLVAK